MGCEAVFCGRHGCSWSGESGGKKAQLGVNLGCACSRLLTHTIQFVRRSKKRKKARARIKSKHRSPNGKKSPSQKRAGEKSAPSASGSRTKKNSDVERFLWKGGLPPKSLPLSPRGPSVEAKKLFSGKNIRESQTLAKGVWGKKGWSEKGTPHPGKPF